MTAADPGSGQRARVAPGLVASVPGLDAGAAQRALTAAGADRGRALREMDALLTEHPAPWSLPRPPILWRWSGWRTR